MNRASLGLLILLGSTGCGGTPGGSDPDSARAALDVWKGGGTTLSLLEKPPSMHVGDYRWEAGYKLTNYKITESSAASGFDRRYPVDLWLTTPKGKALREKAVYNVAMSPSLTVVRDPES